MIYRCLQFSNNKIWLIPDVKIVEEYYFTRLKGNVRSIFQNYRNCVVISLFATTQFSSIITLNGG